MKHIKSKRKKIAIIGAGISGLSAAYFLKKHEIDVYEKEMKLGGHAITLKEKLLINKKVLKTISFDIGFLVYNEKNYPHFSKLLREINVRTEKSNMSFSVNKIYSGFEYGSNGILALTNNFKNFFIFDYWRMLFSIQNFYKKSKYFLRSKNEEISLGKFIKSNNLSSSIIDNHILPMCGAIWSTSTKEVLNMPAKYILMFLNNHGLLNLFDRPQWRTISGGSENYVKKLEEKIDGNIFKNKKVMKVIRSGKKVFIKGRNFLKKYDMVIFAVHADDILKLLDNPSIEEKRVLLKYKYEENDVYVHQDTNLMPKNKKVWSSWNVIAKSKYNKVDSRITVTYWINKLQNFISQYPVLVTLNPPDELLINRNKILKKLKLKHPILKKGHHMLSNKINKLQGKNMTYYTGAWLGYGFHEDGLKSSINISNLIYEKINNE